MTSISENNQAKPLTPREGEILKDISQGLSTKDIGVKYGISAGTVASHRHAILKKTGCKTSAGAVMKMYGAKEPAYTNT